MHSIAPGWAKHLADGEIWRPMTAAPARRHEPRRRGNAAAKRLGSLGLACSPPSAANERTGEASNPAAAAFAAFPGKSKSLSLSACASSDTRTRSERRRLWKGSQHMRDKRPQVGRNRVRCIHVRSETERLTWHQRPHGKQTSGLCSIPRSSWPSNWPTKA